MKLPQLFKSPLTILKNRKLLKKYKLLMDDNHPFKNFIMIPYCLSKEDAIEFFDHYSVFSYWVFEYIYSMSGNRKILDVGGKKLLNAILSIDNEVTSIVLADCKDRISKVKYVIHDVSDCLSFPDDYFDIFLSPGTLHLVGLGRYGDKLDPNVLPRFIKDLNRVMKKKSDLFLLMPLGKNHLLFNFHYIFDFHTLKDMFYGWTVEEYFVDEFVHFNRSDYKDYKERFSRDVNTSNFDVGEYKIIYLHFKR